MNKLLKAADMAREGAGRAVIVRECGLRADQVDEIIRRVGRQPAQSVLMKTKTGETVLVCRRPSK